MELRIFVEPQFGASYDDLLAVARAAEDGGFGAFFRSDHYLTMGTWDGLPGPTDAWVTLAALARETSRIRLGTLVTSATFRLPGPLAIAVAQVDQMSAGRVELGMGAGWFEAEHAAYGIPFPPVRERFDRLEEQLAVVTGLWESEPGSPFSFAGEHYTVRESPGLPKPVQQPGPPVIIGGLGPRRTPRIAATWADEFNVPFASVEVSRERFAAVQAACVAAGRDPASLVYSVAQTTCCGATEADYRRRAASWGFDPAQLREQGLGGTPDEIAGRIAAFAAIGASRVYLQLPDLRDLDHVALLATEVLRRAR